MKHVLVKVQNPPSHLHIMIRNGQSHQSTKMQKIEAKGDKIKSNPLSSNYWIKKTTGIIPGQQYHLHLQHIPVSIMKFCKKTFTVLVYLYHRGLWNIQTTGK